MGMVEAAALAGFRRDFHGCLHRRGHQPRPAVLPLLRTRQRASPRLSIRSAVAVRSGHTADSGRRPDGSVGRRRRRSALSDQAAAEAVTFDLRWKAACGLAIDAESFHPTVLTYWRKRLATSDRPNRIFDAVKSVIADTGVLTGRTRRAVDSTVLNDAVAAQDTVTQLVAAIRRVAATVAGGSDAVARCGTACDYTKPGKPEIAWDDKLAREQFVDALVGDALAIGAALSEPDAEQAEPQSAAGQALALLALVAGQDVEWVTGDGEDTGRWQIAHKVAADRVISTVDTDSRHARKTRSRRQDGYKGLINAEPDTGLITAAKLTKAAGTGSGDAQVGGQLIAADDTLDGAAVVLGDSAYGSGVLLAELADAGHDGIIKPKPVPVPHGLQNPLTADEFTIDHDGQTLTCPNGVTASFANETRTAKFGVVCASCPLRSRCTTATQGRTVAIGDQTMRRDYRQHRVDDPRDTNPALPRCHEKRCVVDPAGAAVNLRRLTVLGLAVENGGWALG